MSVTRIQSHTQHGLILVDKQFGDHMLFSWANAADAAYAVFIGFAMSSDVPSVGVIVLSR